MMSQLRTRVSLQYLFVSSLLIVLFGVVMAGFASHSQRAYAATPAVKIMPLGDSITGSPGCWRALLWNNLQSTGYTNINFVGTLNNSSACGIPFNGNNEGHGGYLATNIANQNLLPGWLSATNPDIVMMHLGTNDVWNNIAPATILSAFTKLVNQMRANNPHMRLLVAQITPMNPSGCSACAQRVINFDAAIPAWASSMSTAQSPITVVDQWTGYNDSTDTIDGVHPNASGNAKIAARWYPALTAQIKAINGGGTGSTPTPTPTSGGGSFNPSAHYKLVSVNSGKALDVVGQSTANGALVDQWTDSGSANQKWNIIAVGGYYKLISVNSGKALDVVGQSTANAALVDQWTDSGTANQQWSIIAVGGNYKLISRNSGKALDVIGQSTANGAGVDQWTDSGSANQQWSIVQVS